MPIRVLHIWNTAGVGSVIAKFTDRAFGTRSRVMTRKAVDRVGLTTFGTAYSDGPAKFFLRALLASGGADVVHVHSLDRIVPWVKGLHGRPVVMHYHGTDIEGRWGEKRNRWSRADYVAVSTPNLLAGAPPMAVYIPNPVDTDIFRPGAVVPSPSSAFSFHYGMDTEAEAAARRLGLSLAWMDRGGVGHQDMPKIFSNYGYFIDLKKAPGHPAATALSKTALEALASGCRVVDLSGKVWDSLPLENRPESVAERWHEVYLTILGGKARANTLL